MFTIIQIIKFQTVLNLYKMILEVSKDVKKSMSGKTKAIWERLVSLFRTYANPQRDGAMCPRKCMSPVGKSQKLFGNFLYLVKG